MQKFKHFLSLAFTLVVLLLGAVSFASCKEDEPDTVTAEFTIGDVISNENGEVVIGPCSYNIHYAGKVTYEAGLAISTVLPFDAKNGGHTVYTTRTHKASNHESYTSYSWDQFKIKIGVEPGVKMTFHYTLFLKLEDGTYLYGPTNKSFTIETHETNKE